MKKKIMLAVLSVMTASILAAGCGGNTQDKKPAENTEKVSEDKQQTDDKKQPEKNSKKKKEAPDLNGDSSVPKTEKEMLGGEGSQSFASVGEMSEAAKVNFDIPGVNGYGSPEYYIENGTLTAVYTNEEGNTISFRKGTDDGLLTMDASYSIIYSMNPGGIEMSFGSRGSEEKAGVAIWSSGEYNYKIETTQWKELSREEMSQLASQVK